MPEAGNPDGDVALTLARDENRRHEEVYTASGVGPLGDQERSEEVGQHGESQGELPEGLETRGNYILG